MIVSSEGGDLSSMYFIFEVNKSIDMSNAVQLSFDKVCGLWKNIQSRNIVLRDKLPENMLHALQVFQNKTTAMYTPDNEQLHFPSLSTISPMIQHYCST